VSFFNIFVAQALLAEQTPTFITTHEERRYAYKTFGGTELEDGVK